MNTVCVAEEVYFGLYKKIGNLTEENKNLKHLNENQMNMIIDLRNEITDLKKQNGDLCELVGKTKDELRGLQDENAARIEAYEKLDKRYEKLLREYIKSMGENAACIVENYRLRRRLDNGCNTCPDMENTKKKNDELRELIDFKRKQIEEQATTIRDLDKKLAELRAGAKDLQEQNQILKDSIKQLRDECSKKEEDIHYWKDKYDVLMTASDVSQIAQAMYKTEIADLKKKLKSVCETCDVPDNCVNASEAVLKDADAKIQSANDKAANAKKETKYAKETAERYRKENVILRKRLQQVEEFNSNLLKEFARKEMNNGNANPD